MSGKRYTEEEIQWLSEQDPSLTYEELAAVRIAAGSICFAETLSLLESLRALHPNAWLSKILSKIVKSKAEKYLDIDLTELEKPNDTSVDNSNKK